MKTDKQRILKIVEELLEEGRGFDLQSHGEKNGDNFYNFALYSPPNTPVSKQKIIYKHSYTMKELADMMERILGNDEQPKYAPIPAPLPPPF